MELNYSKKIENILNNGISLKNIGVKNWALTKSQALTALDYFNLYKIIVLGGDVYENLNGNIQSNYDNWYCDPIAGETKDEFQKRSIEKAREYIENYNKDKDNAIYFVLVPQLAEEE